jgi:glycosyltransferase involved in cell wall biosynthesis
MAKRVLQVTPSYPPVVGGIEDHVANLVHRLPEYGYEPVVLTPDREGVGTEEGVYREAPILSISKSMLAPGVAARHFTLDYDLIHVHAPYHFGQEFSALARLARDIPLVVTVHMYGTRDSVLSRVYDKFVYNRCLDIADVVVPTTQDYVAEFEWFEQHSEKCREVPLGVDVDHYSPVENARERLGYQSDEEILLFVGSMEPLHDYKNVDLLIKTFARRDIGDRLLLVGSGEKRAEYQQLARDEGVGDRVDFPGYVSEADLPTYYSVADAFVLPSTFDSFGIALVEAMACGTPVVATDLPGVREVVGDGGETVSPLTPDALASTIETVLGSEFNTRNRILGRYSHTAVVDSIVDIYDELSEPS